MELSTPERATWGVLRALPDPWPAVASAYLTEAHLQGGSVRTPLEYARILERFFATFPDPGDVTPLSVHSFAYGRSPGRAEPTPSTICVRLAAISGVYEFARRVGAIERNPATDVQRPRPTSPLPRMLETGELRHLLAAIPTTRSGLRDRAMVLLILLTGLRRSEVISLRVRDVDLATGYYEVRVKGGRARRRRIPEPALEAIVSALEERSGVSSTLAPDQPIFAISAAGFYANLRRYAANAGLADVSPHVLRHSAAVLRRRSGASIEEVSSFLGHASIATTAIYLRRLEAEPDEGWRDAATELGVLVVDRDRVSKTSTPPSSVRPGRMRRSPAPITWTRTYAGAATQRSRGGRPA
ncbi:MAG: tyrosine-type recombinase/integrase [Chloroflexi bacterium]|nr:tyrosine-type recombinase/integrase [Chloroflexota bacterium]